MGLILEILKVGGCIYLKCIYQSILLAIHTFIHPSVFVCPSVFLFVYLSIHCLKCNLDNLQSAFLFAHLRNVVFTIFTSQAKDSVCLFYHIYKGITIFFHKLVVSGSLTLGRARNFIPPPWNKGGGGGGGVDRTHPRSF